MSQAVLTTEEGAARTWVGITPSLEPNSHKKISNSGDIHRWLLNAARGRPPLLDKLTVAVRDTVTVLAIWLRDAIAFAFREKGF